MFPEFIVIPEFVAGAGRVVWRATEFLSGPVGAGSVEGKPVEGYVMFSPSVVEMQWADVEVPFTSIAAPVVAPVVDGLLRPVGWDADVDDPGEPDGLFLLASEQPDAYPDAMHWTVSFQLSGVSEQPLSRSFLVPSMGTVDLSTVLSEDVQPGTVRVVSTEDRVRAEEAADLAELAAERAENASLGDIDYDLILEQVEPLVDDVVSVALVPYATTSALTEGLAEKQDAGDYALVSQMPDVSGLATKTALASGLAEKQPVGDYATRDELPDISGLATKTALTSGLAGKQDAGDYATKAELPDLGDYATTAYVDQTVGGIDAALSGILGGE